MDQSTSVDKFASPQPKRYKNTLKHEKLLKSRMPYLLNHCNEIKFENSFGKNLS